jgi:hypothetical protein
MEAYLYDCGTAGAIPLSFALRHVTSQRAIHPRSLGDSSPHNAVNFVVVPRDGTSTSVVSDGHGPAHHAAHNATKFTYGDGVNATYADLMKKELHDEIHDLEDSNKSLMIAAALLGAVMGLMVLGYAYMSYAAGRPLMLKAERAAFAPRRGDLTLLVPRTMIAPKRF